jgi:hypothetical protein
MGFLRGRVQLVGDTPRKLRLRSGFLWGLALFLTCGLGLFADASGSSAAGLSASSLESPGVRQAIASEVGQAPGPMVVSQGGSGGTSEPEAPAGGELVSSLSTAFSDTWRVARRPMVSRIFAAPVNYKGSDVTEIYVFEEPLVEQAAADSGG